MVETYARPRFGEPRQPKNRVNPGSRLVGMIDFVTTSHGRSVAFLLLCGLLFFLPGFFNIPPIDRDEARFAQATKQMVESGDFVDIRFQDDVRYKKPVGIYWLQAAAVETATALGLSARATSDLGLSHSFADRRDWRGTLDLLGGARLRDATRRGVVGAHHVQLGAARRRGAARQDGCHAAVDRRCRDGRAGAGLSVLAARRGSRASALELARDFLDRARSRHPAQGAVDPDVRRAHDPDAGDPRSRGRLAVALASGLGTDVDAGPGAALVRRHLLARRRCLFCRLRRR